MNRKTFILSQGATCKNWNWSWSFINEKDKIIIFGAWDLFSKSQADMILSEDWKIKANGKKNTGFSQSREHIRLILEEGYSLKTFPIYHSDINIDESGNGPAKIKGFEPILNDKKLLVIGGNYYAISYSELHNIPEELPGSEIHFEGTKKTITVNSYERNGKARKECIDHYGLECQICHFDFEKTYGLIGKDYIHVHHITPISEIGESYKVDPIKDLIPVCPNCHSIIHRTKPALTIVEMRSLFENKMGK